MKPQHRTCNPARGFTLLEVMVALVIFSIGLLGLAGLQTQSLRFNHGAFQRTQATFYAYDILDRMRANRDAAIGGNYDIAFGDTPNATSCSGTSASCGKGTMATADKYEWKTALASSLPEGDGKVERDTSAAGTVFVVTIKWGDANESTGNTSVTVRGEI